MKGAQYSRWKFEVKPTLVEHESDIYEYANHT